MQTLDDETLVWDQSEDSFRSPNESGSSAHFTRSYSDAHQVEFLRHFDKAENQLINISSELLVTTLKIGTLPEPEDLASLRQHLIDGINDIKARGAELTYPVAVIDKLCFLYAVVLDEFIIYSDWGEKKGWENKTLLSDLFGMRNGGELFFTVAEKATRQPHKLIDLLEVIYLFLSVGFKGQYRDAGNEKLKSFIYDLEQVISQYRQVGALFCHTKVKLPQVRKPTRRKRYLVTTLFFVCLVVTSIGLTHFWYNKTHDQRARDFAFLADFSQRYILSGEVNDIVFISSDNDLVSAPKKASKVELVDTTPPPTLATSHSSWLVQLATFSSHANALAYLDNLAASAYQAEIDPYQSYYRVIIRTDSSEQAREIKAWYQDKGINPIIVRNTHNNENEQESQ